MLLSRGSFDIFVTHPISAGFLLAAVGLIVLMVIPTIRENKEEAVLEEE
jgi:putative tricarboxylic transport membrane protein